MTEILNVGANNSEIMIDSITGGPISLPSRQKAPPRKHGKLACSFSRIEDAGRVPIAGTNNLLRSRGKLERKLNDKPSVVCIQYYRHVATGNRWL